MNNPKTGVKMTLPEVIQYMEAMNEVAERKLNIMRITAELGRVATPLCKKVLHEINTVLTEYDSIIDDNLRDQLLEQRSNVVAEINTHGEIVALVEKIEGELEAKTGDREFVKKMMTMIKGFAEKTGGTTPPANPQNETLQN